MANTIEFNLFEPAKKKKVIELDLFKPSKKKKEIIFKQAEKEPAFKKIDVKQLKKEAIIQKRKSLKEYTQQLKKEFIDLTTLQNKPIYDFDKNLIWRIRVSEKIPTIKSVKIPIEERMKLIRQGKPAPYYKKTKLDPDEIKFLKNYVDYYNKKQKERFEQSTPEEKELEMKAGGVHDINTQMKAIMDGAGDGLSFGLVDTYNPVYGDFEDQYYNKSYAAGNILGTVIAHIGLSQVAAVAGAPKLIGQIASKSKFASKFLSILGKPKMWADKLPILIKPLAVLGRKYAGKKALEVGAIGVTSMLIKSTADTTRNYARRYHAENKMSKKDYQKYLKNNPYWKAIGGGLLKGYGISFINDPRGLPFRFLGDLMYGGAEEVYEGLTTGKFDEVRFMKNVILGHVLGEVQGRIFSPSRKQINMALGDRTLKRFMEYHKNKYDIPYKESWFPNNSLAMALLRYSKDTGRMPADNIIQRELDRVGILYTEKGFTIRKAMEYPEIKELNLKDYVKTSKIDINVGYRSLKKQLDLSNKEIDLLKKLNVIEDKNVDNFIEILRKTKTISRGKVKTQTAKKVFKLATEKIKYLNSVTGLKKDLLTDSEPDRLIKKNKGAIISFSKDWKNVGNSFNRNIADQALYKGAHVVKSLVDEINEKYIERDAKIYIKNPTDNNNTKLVLYQENMTTDEFKNNVSYIMNVLKNNYAKEYDYSQRFAISIQRTDKKYDILTDFKNTEATFVDDVKDLKGYKFVLDEDLPAWKSAKIDENEYIGKEKSNIGEYVNKRREEHQNDVDYETFNYEEMIKSPAVADEFSKSCSDASIKMSKTLNNLSERLIDMPLYKGNGIKGFWNDKTALGNIIRRIKELGNITYGLDQAGSGRKIMSSVYEISLFPKKGANFATKQLTDIYNKYLISKGVKGNQWNNRHGDILFYAAMETEARGAIKDKINANRFKDDIMWKTRMEIDTDKFKMKRLNFKKITDFRVASNDPYLYGKLMYRLYDIKPEVILDLYTKGAQEISEILSVLRSQVTPVTMYDEDFNLAEILKKQYKKTVIDYLNKYTTKEYLETLNFDDLRNRETIKKDIDLIQDEKLRAKTKRLLNHYFTTDPDRWSWVPHITLADKANQKIFDNGLDKILEGKIETGLKALSPIIEDRKNRAFANITQSIQAGYKLKDVGLFEAMHSEISYLKTKLLIKQTLKNFRFDFLRKYQLAKSSGNMKHFYENEIGAYLYKPSDAEFKKIDQELVDINKELGFIGAAKETATVNKITRLNERTVYLTRLKNVMESLNKDWNGELGTRYIENKILEGVSVPLHLTSFLDDTTMPPGLKSLIIPNIKKFDIHAYSIPETEGLYFNQAVYRMMKQYIFRDNYLTKSPDVVDRAFWKMYDNINGKMKTAKMVKPQIMWNNNIGQMLRVNPFWLKDFITGYKDCRDKSKFYQAMENEDLLNRLQDNRPVFSDAYKAVHDVFGQKGVVFRKAIQNFSEGKNLWNKLTRPFITLHRGVQEVTWKGDEVQRMTLARSVNKRFLKVYLEGDPAYLNSLKMHKGLDFSKMSRAEKFKQANRVTADYVNQHMVHYSNMPTKTRQGWNRVLLYFTYRSKTFFEMYLKDFADAGQGAMRLFGKETEPRYLHSTTRWKQALYEMAPTFNTFTFQAAFKILSKTALGYGAFTLFDWLTDYRVKKKKGDALLDQSIETISVGSPIFEINKYIQRPLKVVLRYNISAVLGLLYSWIWNVDLITGKPVITEPLVGGTWKNSKRAMGQLSMNLIKNYFPLGSDFYYWLEEDKTFFKKVVNSSGLAYIYSKKSPNEMLEDIERAMEKGTTVGEHNKRMRKFYRRIAEINMELFNELFEDSLDEVQRARKEYLELEIKK